MECIDSSKLPMDNDSTLEREEGKCGKVRGKEGPLCMRSGQDSPAASPTIPRHVGSVNLANCHW